MFALLLFVLLLFIKLFVFITPCEVDKGECTTPSTLTFILLLLLLLLVVSEKGVL